MLRRAHSLLGLALPAGIRSPQLRRYSLVLAAVLLGDPGTAVRAVAAAHPDARIAVVTHGGVLDMVWRTAQGLPLSGPRTCAIPNAGLNRIRVRGESIEIVSWGDDAHVADLGPAPGPAPTEGAAEAAAATIHPGPDAADRTG